MTLAAAACVDGGPAPTPLIIAWQCKQWNTLPSELFKQDTALMMQMSHCLKVYEAVNGAQNASNLAEWAKANPDLAYIDAMVRQIKRNGDRT